MLLRCCCVHCDSVVYKEVKRREAKCATFHSVFAFYFVWLKYSLALECRSQDGSWFRIWDETKKELEFFPHSWSCSNCTHHLDFKVRKGYTDQGWKHRRVSISSNSVTSGKFLYDPSEKRRNISYSFLRYCSENQNQKRACILNLFENYKLSCLFLLKEVESWYTIVQSERFSMVKRDFAIHYLFRIAMFDVA